MKNKGWETIRINWGKYQKFNKDEKVIFIQKLIEYITKKEISNFEPIYKIDKIKTIKIKTIKEKKDRKKYFCECGNPIHIDGHFCVKCSRIKRRKVERPSNEILLKNVNENGYKGTGQKYGVSDN